MSHDYDHFDDYPDNTIKLPSRDEDIADKFDRAFRMKKRPRSLLARGSNPVKIEFQDGDGNWRTQVRMERIKFDDKRKAIFLDEYKEWGRIVEAASAAGVTPGTVRGHLESDPEFAEAFLLCEQEYKDKLIRHHQDLVFNGTVKETYDRTGKVVSRETIYPIRLIELELKKHDPGYRDKQEVSINHTGGVLLVPSEMGSIDDWEKRFNQAKDVTPQTPLIDRVTESEEDEDDEGH